MHQLPIEPVRMVIKNGMIYFKGVDGVDPGRGITIHSDEEFVLELSAFGTYYLNIKPLHYGGWVDK
jgi:hypothetical protein